MKFFLVFSLLIVQLGYAQQNVCDVLDKLMQYRKTNFKEIIGSKVTMDRALSNNTYESTLRISGSLETFIYEDYVSKRNKWSTSISKNSDEKTSLGLYTLLVSEIKKCAVLNNYTFTEKISGNDYTATWNPQGENPLASDKTITLKLTKEFEIDKNLNSTDIFLLKLEFGN